MKVFGLKITVDATTTSRCRWTRRAVVVGVASSAVFASGVAYAFWTSSASGSGTAAARSFTAPTVAAGTASGVQLYPTLTADGSTAGGTLVANITNDNPFKVQVTSIAPNGTVTVDAGHSSCTTTGVSVFSGTIAGPTVVANASAAPTSIPFVVSMSNASVDGCQGATFTIPVTLGFSSST